MGLGIALVVLSIGLGIILGIPNYQKAHKASREGNIIKRSSSFWEEVQLFELNAPYEAVVEGVKHSDPVWNTRNSMPYGLNEMNIFLTVTEKMLLRLDPMTTVEIHKKEISTSTKFF